MKVLILGVTGYLGRPIAQSFLRKGHTVIGQTRSQASARSLEAEEIIPLVADPTVSESWRGAIRDVDCVVDAVGGMDIKRISAIVLQTVVDEAAKSRAHGPPLSFIYASGTWVHGDSLAVPHGSQSDLTPTDSPMPLTAWRVAHERAVLASQSAALAPNVVRPALVYGKSGGITGIWMASAKAGEVRFAGPREARLAMVHVDDAARLFVLVAEKALAVRGVTFDAANPFPEPILHILTQLAQVSGAKGPTFVAAADDFQKATASSNLLRPALARALVDWEPRKPPMGEGMDIYYKAWLASL